MSETVTDLHTGLTLAVGDYLQFRDKGRGSIYRGRELQGLLTKVAIVPLHTPLPSGRMGTPLFRAGSVVFLLQPWETLQGPDRWWIAPEIRYSLDDVEVLRHIPATPYKEPAHE